MREKSGKKGHRREISKQLIKRRLMQDLYPIPRQKESTSRLKMKSILNNKFTNTLQFLEYNQTQQLMLQKFKQKLLHQLTIPPVLLENSLEFLYLDNKIYKLIKKLVNLHSKRQQTSQTHLIYLLKNLISTAKPQIRSIVTLLFFYHFFCVNIEQYRTVMKYFDQNNIYSLACSINYPICQLLTSKILSAVLIIIIKYNQTKKIFQMAAQIIKLRRMIQRNFNQRQDLGVNHDHARLTLFFRIKHIQTLIKYNTDPYQLMCLIQDELIVNDQTNSLITSQVEELYKQQMLKLKKVVQSKIDEDYYQKYRSQQKVIRGQHKKEKIQIATKTLKRRKSLNFTTIQSSEKNEYKSHDEMLNRNNQAQLSKKFKDVYNPPRKLTHFSKLNSQSNLKKGRKLIKGFLFESTNQSAVSQKIDLQTVQQFSEKNVEQKMKSRSKQKQINPTLFMKLSSLYQIKSNYIDQADKQTENEKLEKKKKILKVYQKFSNLNKVVRQIPRKQLQKEFQKLQKIQIGLKSDIKQMLSTQIIHFSAGLQNGNYDIGTILNNKGCSYIQFIKVWLGQTYIISIKLEVQSDIFLLKVVLNGVRYNIALNRGSNVLCERYVTIWPTIRYLVNKKLYQFRIFKRYQGLLLIKKMTQASLIKLESDIYLQKFGFISKQQIQEINICLDSVFKVVIISKQYYNSCLFYQTIKINQQIKFPYLLSFKKDHAQTMKLNLLTEIYLTMSQQFTLISFLHTTSEKFFYIKVNAIKENLINSIKNKEELQVILTILNLQSFQIKFKDHIRLQWDYLEQNLIFFEDFKKYFIQFCTSVAKNQHFANKFVNFFEKRLIIKYHPIFPEQSRFWRVPIKRQNRAFKSEQGQGAVQIDRHFRRHRIQNIQCYCEEQANAINQIQIKKHKSLHDSNRLYDSKLDKKVNKKQIDLNFKHPKEIIRINGLEKKQIWRQQKRLNGKQYLMIMSLIQEPITEQWTAELIMISRKSQTKHLIVLNHLDLFRIYDSSLARNSLYSSDNSQHQLKTTLRAKRNTMLVELINSVSFFYNYQVLKICLQKKDKFYRHNFRQQLKLQQQIAKIRQNSNTFYSNNHPLLQNFNLFCRLRILKPMKIGMKYGFLTFKQNIVHQHAFWQIILEFPRRTTHFVYRMKQQNMIFYISDHRKKKVNDFILIPSFTQFQENLSVSVQQDRYEDVINFKSRILPLINSKQIQIVQKQQAYILVFCQDELEMRERIIHHFDPSTACIYNVWINNQFIQVDIEYACQQTEQLNLSATESSFLNNYKKQIIGHIQLGAAYRFYQMENKDLNQQQFYLKRVCQFYFDYIKQQKLKFDKNILQKSNKGSNA